MNRPPVLSLVPARSPFYITIVTRMSRRARLPLGVCFSPSWRWCRATAFPQKTSSTAAVANSSPTSSTPPNAAWTSSCVITRRSYARSPAVTRVPSKCLQTRSIGFYRPAPIMYVLQSCHVSIMINLIPQLNLLHIVIVCFATWMMMLLTFILAIWKCQYALRIHKLCLLAH